MAATDAAPTAQTLVGQWKQQPSFGADSAGRPEGDPNVAFAWRLSATRKGYVEVRLEEVQGVDHEAAK